MKITILQFAGESERENAIGAALTDARIRVKRVKNLSRFHILAASGIFDAILINRKVLARYRMRPMRHLWEHHSRQVILVWTENDSARLEIAVNALPATAFGTDEPKGRAEKISTIQHAIHRALERIDGLAALPQEENGDGAGKLSAHGSLPAFSPTFGSSLHRKLRMILELLVTEGETGASVERIRDVLWPGDARDRKKDIQAYVSRLRGRLNRSFTGQYGIHRERNRYILRKRAG